MTIIPDPDIQLSDNKGRISRFWWDYLSGLSGSSSATSSSFDSSLLSNRNYLYNSGFIIIQRGGGPWTAGAATFTADRWCLSRGGTAGATLTRTASVNSSRYKMRVQRDSGTSATAVISFYQALDSLRSKEFVGQTATLSFYAASGADFSPTSASMVSTIYTGTGTDETASSATVGTWTGIASSSFTASLTSTRSLFSQSFLLSTSTSQIAVSFKMTPVGTAGTADYFEIDSPKLEVGSAATAYSNLPDVQAFSDCAMFYEDMGRDPFTGALGLRVVGPGSANTAGGASGTPQYFWSAIQCKSKRNINHTLTVGGSTSWHVTTAGGSSIYNLLSGTVTSSDFWSHQSVESGLLQFHYQIDGTHPALANYHAVLVAVDGAADSKFAIDCELSP